MMKESYERDLLIDKVSVAREFRGFVQGVWFFLTTGEPATVSYGWQTDTCVAEYHQLDPVGRFGLRTAPTLVGLALAAFTAQLSLTWPTGWVWLPVAYIAAMWALFSFYDLAAWAWVGLRGPDTPIVEAKS